MAVAAHGAKRRWSPGRDPLRNCLGRAKPRSPGLGPRSQRDHQKKLGGPGPLALWHRNGRGRGGSASQGPVKVTSRGPDHRWGGRYFVFFFFARRGEGGSVKQPHHVGVLSGNPSDMLFEKRFEAWQGPTLGRTRGVERILHRGFRGGPVLVWGNKGR